MLHNNSLEFIWEIPEFVFKKKTKKWYWVVGIAAIFLIAAAIFLKNYLFAFLIIIAWFLMFSLSDQQPETILVEISEEGIKLNNQMYPYTEIAAFHVTETTDNEYVLLFISQQPINPVISIKIKDSINVLELRKYLMLHLEEHKINEPLSNKIINRIGF